MKLSQFLKNELGRGWNADNISATTEGALSKRTANNWYNGEKRPILDLLVDGLKYRQQQAGNNNCVISE